MILLSFTKSIVVVYCGHIDLLKLSVKLITKTYVSRKLRIQFEFINFFPLKRICSSSLLLSFVVS